MQNFLKDKFIILHIILQSTTKRMRVCTFALASIANVAMESRNGTTFVII